MKWIILVLICEIYCKGLQERFTWSKIDYQWPSTPHRSKRGGSYASAYQQNTGQILFPDDDDQGTTLNVNRDDYIYENNIPMGANRWRNKLFITVPRRRAGVPSTLNYIWTNSTQTHNVPLIPYPDWRMNQLSTSDGFVSVYRTGVDSCDRLWMVDTGLIEIPGNNTRIKPASIVVMDLHTERIIRRHVISSSLVKPESTLASIFIDGTPTDCDKAFAYIPDLTGYGIIVYSFQDNDSWRVTHNYFHLEPSAGDFNVGGIAFQWNDGVFSLGLSHMNFDGSRTVYFHSMAGTHMYSVSTNVLRNRKLATRSYHDSDFKIEIDKGNNSQTSATDLHQPSGVLFLGLVNQNALGCWNTRKGSHPSSFDIVHRDNNKLIYPCDVKIANDDVILLSNSMPVFLYGHLNYDQTNFRVWISSVADAIRDTRCAK